MLQILCTNNADFLCNMTIQEQRDSGGNTTEEGELTEATLWV
jgi:hypothetical protein